MKLDQLQSDCCDHLFEPSRFCAAPQADNAPRALEIRRTDPPTPAERLAVRTIVAEGAAWFAWNQPDRASRRTWHRFRDAVRESANESVSRVCGFGLIIGAILAWLIEKALDWLWDWWKRTPRANALVCGMVSPI